MTEAPAPTRPGEVPVPPDATVPGLAGPDAGPRGGSAPPASAARRVVTGVLLPAGAIGLVAVALLMPARMALSDLQRVGAVLILLAAISAAVLVRAGERTPQWQVAIGTFAAAGAFACYRLAAHLTGSAHAAALRSRHRRDADRHRRVRAPGPGAAGRAAHPAAGR